MIRKKRYLAAKMGLLALGLMLLFPGQAEAADKKTIYNSPYVSFSPDGKAFTTCAGDQNYTWYAEDDSTTVYTGIKSSLRSLRTGEHYYKVARWGEVPVGSWKVVHRPGQCIHDGYTSDENWHGIQFGTQKCMQYYYSGCRLWGAFGRLKYIYEQGGSLIHTVLRSWKRKKSCFLLLPLSFLPELRAGSGIICALV